MKLAEILSQLDAWFPPRLAESWDNVGLLIGDPQDEIASVMTCLTVTPESAAEAVDRKAELVVSHHPIFFRPVQRLTAGGPNAFLLPLLRAGISVYSPHTAFDGAAEGINQQIGERIGLQEMKPLRPAVTADQVKVVVFVPASDLAKVQDAMFAAGAGQIGEYTECSFRLTGTGSFRGSEASNPTIGERGRREEVTEHRLEVVVPSQNLAAVLTAMRQAHSYEEPAFDVYPLQSVPTDMGAGRRGVLVNPLSIEELATKVAEQLSVASVEYVGFPSVSCRHVAIGCGAGAEFLRDAAKAGCDAFITGEARFHQHLEAQLLGVGLILVGHYASERFAVETLAQRLSRQFPNMTVWASEREQDPVRRITR